MSKGIFPHGKVTRKFTITVTTSDEVTTNQLREYIHDAVGNWSGGGDPEDPLFDLNSDDVKVTRQNKRTPPKKYRAGW